MTCIVSIEDGPRVWMGADSLGSAGYSKTVRRDPKIFRRGPYLIGFSGSFRLGQLLRWKLSTEGPPSRATLAEFMSTTFVDNIWLMMKDGALPFSRGGELPGSFCVGLHGRLFVVEDDMQIGEPACGYEAIGHGADIARGALFAAPNLGARDRIKLALTAAANFDSSVQRPFVIKHVDREQDDA